MMKVSDYAWFLPKAYGWLQRLISVEKMKEIESTYDLKSYLNSLKGTRLASSLPFTADPIIIELTIRKFYKKEINDLFMLIPRKIVKSLEIYMLPVFVREFFSVIRHIEKQDRDWLEIFKDSFITINSCIIKEALSWSVTKRIDSKKIVTDLLHLIDNQTYLDFLKDIESTTNSNLDTGILETYYFLKSLNNIRDNLSSNSFGIDIRRITCPYIDLEATRTIAFYFLTKKEFPKLILSLGPIGCMKLLLSTITSDKDLEKVYMKLANSYKFTIETQRNLYELDREIGFKLRQEIIKSSRKAFANYPFTISIPIALASLLLQEKNILLSNLSRIVFVS